MEDKNTESDNTLYIGAGVGGAFGVILIIIIIGEYLCNWDN